jgi:hypothetical protein
MSFIRFGSEMAPRELKVIKVNRRLTIKTLISELFVKER